MTNHVFIEYLHYNNGAKYNAISDIVNLNVSALCPGLENTVLQSTENIKLQGTNLIYEYSRFLYNGQRVSSLTAYSPSVDWTLGDRSNINAICLWVIGGLVNFDIFLDNMPSMMQLLDKKIIPHNELSNLLNKINSTFGEWLDHEDTLGFSWAKENYNRKTSIIKQNLDLESIKNLIKDLSRFGDGDGVAFLNQIRDSERVFIDPESKLSISTNVHGIYNQDQDEIITSIIKRIAPTKSYYASEIDNLNNQSSNYKAQAGILSEQLNGALIEIENYKSYISNRNNDQVLLNEFKQVANQIVNSNGSPSQADGLWKIENALNSLRQQIAATKSQGDALDLNVDQESNDIWHYSLIGIIILLIGTVLGYGVSSLFSNSKSSVNTGPTIENTTIKEISSNQKQIIDKLDRLLTTEKIDIKPASNYQPTPPTNSNMDKRK
jgi:hypothetical protein